MPSNKHKYTINSAIHLSVQSHTEIECRQQQQIQPAYLQESKPTQTQTKAEKKRETVRGYSCMQKREEIREETEREDREGIYVCKIYTDKMKIERN